MTPSGLDRRWGECTCRMSVFPTAACTIWAACRSTARRLGRRELAPAISRPSAACQRSVPGRRDGRPCVRGDPDRTNRLSGAVPLKVRPVSLSSDTVGVATRNPGSAEVGGATDDRVRSPASAEGCPGSGATIAVGSTETPSRRANVGPLCQVHVCQDRSSRRAPPRGGLGTPLQGVRRPDEPTDRRPARPRAGDHQDVLLRPDRGEGPCGQGPLPGGVPRLWRVHATTERQGRRLRVLQGVPSGAIERRWTREIVLAAMSEWRARYGRLPSSYDWSRTHARRRGGRALERLSYGDWPPASVVSDVCGDWPQARADAAARMVGRALMTPMLRFSDRV